MKSKKYIKSCCETVKADSQFQLKKQIPFQSLSLLFLLFLDTRIQEYPFGTRHFKNLSLKFLF